MSEVAVILWIGLVAVVNWYFGYQTGKEAGLAERDKLWDEVHGVGNPR